ncbi:hypothetical protein [Cellulomonas sp. Root137]|uniref:hypothetical protein n=1 Tax=Cellulomonas sp. Root137 TaxID=1736459 RepID=UPI0006FC8F5A|nr:hypothetical protein [Cellulomonas sp. Root137]KQY41868.1 hypothetical protein ASD18_19715 [Cellulomonas sp. Root137]
MSEQLQGVVVGAVISGVVAVILWWFNSKAETARTKLQIDAATHQTRYPDLVRAASDFATEMRRLNLWHLQYTEKYGYSYVDDPGPDGFGVARDEPTAEVLVATLEFFAEDRLRDAARAWLEAFYLDWYGPAPEKLPEGVSGTAELLTIAEKQFIAEVRRALKVSAPERV